MKIEVDQVTVELTPHEARIIVAFMEQWHEEDPYGVASNHLGLDVDLVASVCDEFREGLKRRIES